MELLIKDVVNGENYPAELKVSEAIETCVGDDVEEHLRESCLKFNVRFSNNMRMHLYIYVVYANPQLTVRSPSKAIEYYWMPVTRSKCKKSCAGPVIRGVQRFGRMPRRGLRSGSNQGGSSEDSWKDPKHLYIAIDEASTHVGISPQNSTFRLLLAAYNHKNELLGSTISSRIRVLANNDAPNGAASFKIHLNIRGNSKTKRMKLLFTG